MEPIGPARERARTGPPYFRVVIPVYFLSTRWGEDARAPPGCRDPLRPRGLGPGGPHHLRHGQPGCVGDRVRVRQRRRRLDPVPGQALGHRRHQGHPRRELPREDAARGHAGLRVPRPPDQARRRRVRTGAGRHRHAGHELHDGSLRDRAGAPGDGGSDREGHALRARWRHHDDDERRQHGSSTGAGGAGAGGAAASGAGGTAAGGAGGSGGAAGKSGKGGCGCEVTPAGGEGWVAGLVALAVLAARRRRR